MAKTPKRLYGPAQLGSSTATRYTVPASTKTVIRKIEFSNPTGSPVTVTASIGADAAGTRFLDGYSIAAGGRYEHWCYRVMDASEILAINASSPSAVVCEVYGDEITLG